MSKGIVRDLRDRVRFRIATSDMLHRLRQRSNSRRMLPTYLIVGAQKAGTTTLHAMLGRHPRIREPWRKEINYFSFRYPLGPDWYRAHFPRSGPGLITGEGTTNTMFHPLAASRAADLVPSARIIVLLREPASRAFSHYRMNVAIGDDNVSFREAIESEEARTEGELERILADPSYPAWPFRRFSYAARGRYLEQIHRLEAHFPRDQILVLNSQELFREPDRTMERVFHHIGIEPHPVGPMATENPGKSNVAPDPEVMATLRQQYKPLDEALFDRLGVTPWW